jgi:adenosylmethionine-8-amino-7-oxononanoate aminotransferase
MLIESSAGCNKGQSGDTLMIAPAFVVTEAEIDKIVDRLDGVLTLVEKKNGF